MTRIFRLKGKMPEKKEAEYDIYCRGYDQGVDDFTAALEEVTIDEEKIMGIIAKYMYCCAIDTTGTVALELGGQKEAAAAIAKGDIMRRSK